MAINEECLHASRPWKKYGEGPTVVPGGLFSERKAKPFTAEDIRFVTKNGKLYVFCLGLPQSEIVIRSLAKSSGLWEKPITSVRIIGSDEKPKWALEDAQLRIQRPIHNPSDYTLGFEIA
jgi:alpha-L-fucosidase